MKNLKTKQEQHNQKNLVGLKIMVALLMEIDVYFLLKILRLKKLFSLGWTLVIRLVNIQNML